MNPPEVPPPPRPLQLPKEAPGSPEGSEGSSLPEVIPDPDLRPTCPMLSTVDVITKEVLYFPLRKLKVCVDVHVDTARVTFQGVWQNITSRLQTCVLDVPMWEDGFVTHIRVALSPSGRQFECMTVANVDGQMYQEKGDPMFQSFERPLPGLFRRPVYSVWPGEEVVATVTAVLPLKFENAGYSLSVPLTLPRQIVPTKKIVSKIVEVSCNVHSCTPLFEVSCASHPIVISHMSDCRRRISLATDNTRNFENTDFVLSYTLTASNIMCSLLLDGLDAGGGDYESGDRKFFTLFLSPPLKSNLKTRFPRQVIYLIDVSESMGSNILRDVGEAVCSSLAELRDCDVFNIIAFNETVIPWQHSLMQALPSNVTGAKMFARTLTAGGKSNVLQVIQFALMLLKTGSGTTAEAAGVGGSRLCDPIDTMYLVTDGAFRGERDVCKYVRECASTVRIHTVGIGPFCNHYFLKVLAQLGRGKCHMVCSATDVRATLEHVLLSTQDLVLSDIAVFLPEIQDAHVHPAPLQDLYCGSPLVVRGTYTGDFPEVVTVQGRLATLEVFQCVAYPFEDLSRIDLSKLLAPETMSRLTSWAWLLSSNELLEQAVKTSFATNVPCAYTSLVGYETTAERKTAVQKQALKRENEKGVLSRTAMVGLLSSGSVCVLGLLNVSYGDIHATEENCGTESSMVAVWNNGWAGCSTISPAAGGTQFSGLPAANSVVLPATTLVFEEVLAASAVVDQPYDGIATVNFPDALELKEPDVDLRRRISNAPVPPPTHANQAGSDLPRTLSVSSVTWKDGIAVSTKFGVPEYAEPVEPVPKKKSLRAKIAKLYLTWGSVTEASKKIGGNTGRVIGAVWGVLSRTEKEKEKVVKEKGKEKKLGRKGPHDRITQYAPDKGAREKTTKAKAKVEMMESKVTPAPSTMARLEVESPERKKDTRKPSTLPASLPGNPPTSPPLSHVPSLSAQPRRSSLSKESRSPGHKKELSFAPMDG